MISKKTIMTITAMFIISMGMLSACGSVASTEQKSENIAVTENENVPDNENAENVNEMTEPISEESTFGLKDYEGLYCMTATDVIEDYEVTYTWGYQLNGDGTGMYYGQDDVDITWNETEIHTASNTYDFTMEPGKLTVDGITYNKVEGNFITPDPCEVDVDNIENGIYHAYISEYGINENAGKLTVEAEINTVETYDIVDINRMAVGDVIYINGLLLPVNSIDHTDFGIININGGVENFGSALIAEDESNCFVHAGIDMEKSFTRHGIANLPVSENVKLIDQKHPDQVKEYTGNEAISVFKEIVHEEPLDCDNCTITVENGEIVEINRLYVP